jgi:hypothetical protein
MMKQVVFNIERETVKIEDCNVERIYILKANDGNFYKLHQGNKLEDPFIWCSLSDSRYNRNGSHDTFEEALMSAKSYGKIYEFSSLAEFAQWLAKEVPQ